MFTNQKSNYLLYIPTLSFILLCLYSAFIEEVGYGSGIDRLSFIGGFLFIPYLMLYLGNMLILLNKGVNAKNTSSSLNRSYIFILILHNLSTFSVIKSIDDSSTNFVLFFYSIIVSFIFIVVLFSPGPSFLGKIHVEIKKTHVLLSMSLIIIYLLIIVGLNINQNAIAKVNTREWIENNQKRIVESKNNQAKGGFTVVRGASIEQDVNIMTNIVANIGPNDSLYQDQRSGEIISLQEFCKLSVINDICKEQEEKNPGSTKY